MSEYDDRMWKMLQAEPTTSCEKWAAAKIKSLEHGLQECSKHLQECMRENDALERKSQQARAELDSIRQELDVERALVLQLRGGVQS